jgi:exodeoxyribonuclease VII small subunit
MPDPENAPENAAEDAAEDAAEQLGYEEARDPLVEVVRTWEQGGTTLAESLTLWERGEELARVCQSALDGARKRLDAALGEDES